MIKNEHQRLALRWLRIKNRFGEYRYKLDRARRAVVSQNGEPVIHTFCG